MTLEHISQQEDSIARRYDYDDGELIAADFGTADVSVDVLGDVAIVVVERDGESFQTEIELSADDAQAFINNGVLTIEVGQ